MFSIPIKGLLTTVNALTLTACVAFNENFYHEAPTPPYHHATYHTNESHYDPGANYPSATTIHYYPQAMTSPNNYLPSSNYLDLIAQPEEINSPVKAKDMDTDWVNNQNPGTYTIEVADSEKASEVAGILYHSPKKERMAEIPYQQGRKTHYKGLYGSYDSKETAQKALNELPPDIQKQAGIVQWQAIQGKSNQFKNVN